MLDPLDTNNRPFYNALLRKRKYAFAVLSIEQISIHLWRLFFWICLFFGLWMLGLPAFFGQGASIITVLIFLSGLIYLIRTDILSFRWPDIGKTDHIIEQASQLPRGHIAALNDHLANPQKHETRDLWQNAQIKLMHALKTLKFPKPRALLSREDPSALRFIALLILIAGYMVSGTQSQSRIINGLFPISIPKIISQDMRANLWVIPPEYTKAAQIHIIGNTDKDTPLEIPEGSTIRIRIYSALGAWLPPYINIGETSLSMRYLDQKLYGFEGEITDGTGIKITQGGFPRASWYYQYIQDTPPEIDSDVIKANETESSPFEVLKDNTIRFPLIVKDDYGVKDLRMTMALNDIVEDKPLGAIAEDTRLIMSLPNTEFKINPVYDMTAHTWAGLPVTFTFTAIDHKGQEATLDKIDVTLPERIFEHPVAKSLIAMRKRLAWEYKSSFVDIARNLEALLDAPDFYQNDVVIFMAIQSAARRLLYNENAPQNAREIAAKSVIALLWDTALSIEDGNISLAMRELKDAQRALENAMRDPNAAPDKISRLMDNLRDKMAQYFKELQRDMQKRAENGEPLPNLSAEDFGKIISPDTIGKLMEQIESAMRAGDEEKAKELMSQLQRMMEMMDPSMAPCLPMDMQAMQEGINELQELIDRQEMLLEQTQKHGYDTDGAASGHKTEQEALRYVLGQLMLDVGEKLDEIPETMGLAEQDMRASEKALGDLEPQESVPHQEDAIKHLKESQEDLAKKFQTRMQQMVGIGFNGAPMRRDPLGRPYESPESDVKIPDEARKKREAEILKTLRDRSGDLNRPDEELDYFRRLLRQFY